MPDYFARPRVAYMWLACRKLRCFCCGWILGPLAGYCATQELCKNNNFTIDMKVKNLNFFSSYYRLNRSSLGQISEFLRLRKGSYSNFLSEIELILQCMQKEKS